ncbi:hypothetical protein A4A49_10706 [Nicotiana attenuata]|uniref:Uncharacterized protein n=1 Tax=Nicotiana attenuata TaxID=49451 RepID=A0A314KPK3_NICAT|nr:hypothetical protein A4A49_10706 [Nicotiana attenuata]
MFFLNLCPCFFSYPLPAITLLLIRVSWYITTYLIQYINLIFPIQLQVIEKLPLVGGISQAIFWFPIVLSILQAVVGRD